jgi:hypothetical protein
VQSAQQKIVKVKRGRAHPPQLGSMAAGTSNLFAHRCKTAWTNKCGAEAGERFNVETERHVVEIDRLYRRSEIRMGI